MTWVSEMSGIASMGMFRMAHQPAMPRPKINRNTMNRFRALKSIMRSTIPLSLVLHALHTTHRSFELALGVEEEVSRSDDVLVLLEALQHLHPVPSTHSQLYSTPFELPASEVNEDELPLSRVQNGIGGDHESRPQWDLQRNIGIHPWLELLAGIHQLKANFGGTRLRLEGGV